MFNYLLLQNASNNAPVLTNYMYKKWYVTQQSNVNTHLIPSWMVYLYLDDKTSPITEHVSLYFFCEFFHLPTWLNTRMKEAKSGICVYSSINYITIFTATLALLAKAVLLILIYEAAFAIYVPVTSL